MSSIKQIDANPLNAGKSTGRRTGAGKPFVAANALKHGIFARSRPRRRKHLRFQ